MRLFRKTLLFFIAVIVFQSALTIPLVTGIIRRANMSEARQELKAEAAILFDSFNSWKRQIWISLIQIASEEHALPRAEASAGVGEAARTLRELLLRTKVDAIATEERPGVISALVQAAPGSFLMSDLEGLKNVKSHPYIQVSRIHGVLTLIGVRTVVDSVGRRNVFLIKRIDTEFCSQLTRNRGSSIAFLTGARIITGSPGIDPSTVFFDPNKLASSYVETYNRAIGSAHYNIAVQRMGRLDQEEAGDELFFATFLSNESFNQRLLLASRAVLLVSLAAALLTILVSLFLSRNITRPIADLLTGMERITTGALDARVQIRGGYEASLLSMGFNAMTQELEHSRAAMQHSMRETLLLKEYNEKIIDSIRAGIAIVNGDLVVEKANNAFLESFGLEASRVVGAPLTWLDIDIVDEMIVEKILSIFRREKDFVSEVKRSGRGRVYEIRLYPFYSPGREISEASGCVFMTDDISARTELEEKIFQAEKLSSISMLSAGMAHEINNPLSSILTNVQNLIDEETRSERSVSLKWIEQETRRIARIVQELLNFSAADAVTEAGSDVNGVVEEVVRLVGSSFARGGRIRIDTRLARELPHAVVSPDELKQVVINLLRNSVQAIDGPGRVLVSTWQPRGSASRISSGNGRVSLAVSDTGRGIAKEVLPRIFDPFFTTKANGEGTGLGLSVVYGIVRKYNGSIDVKSTEHRGTRVSLSLPCHDGGAP